MKPLYIYIYRERERERERERLKLDMKEVFKWILKLIIVDITIIQYVSLR